MAEGHDRALDVASASLTGERDGGRPISREPTAPACASAGLSNDFLNHYSEALMLIEMAPDAPEVVADLASWRPLTYRAYFEASPLRRAAAAIAAYDALPAARRAAFDELTEAMDRLAHVAVLALQPPCEAEEAALIAEVTGSAFRRLVDRAAGFLNSGGRDLPGESEVEEAQAAIDRLIGRAGAAPA